MTILNISKFLPAFAADILLNLAYLLRLKPGVINVGDVPYLDEEALPYFLSALGKANVLLEFGCGGSTVAAAKMGKKFISVESDPKFLQAVKSKAGPVVAGAVYIYADIGKTGAWGIPIFKRITSARLARWRTYYEAPWDILNACKDDSVLVLVDGRFRVACALSAFKRLQDNPGALILVDDYIGRPEYNVLEKYGDLVEVVGRMAVFRPKPIDVQAIELELVKAGGLWL
ncbi:hypothetical protein AEP_03106 [Curvibacter sp. AEP1-3]|jgi:hypothetical protein|uniref:hypothetical protein n=1 Tax=Curvibacter sp. AEP1-3 TaxID=1844971 RepID=UPI000B3C458C|nr:hypothetical protein [Curvibacter sp. AEP1-3]ARV20031.1 hypothetical protein AEP_03106 [Curvibacter sp. AEP1-3]